MAQVFVTDGRSIAALAAVRSLGAQGLSVTCGESFKYNYASYSRHAQKSITYADPDDKPDQFLEDLDRELARGTYQAIIPIRDSAPLLLAKHRGQFERHTGFCLPDYETLLIGRDKGKTAKAAIKYNIPIPRTFFPEEQSLEDISRSIKFPALIKPRISSGARGIVFVPDEITLFQSYEAVKANYGEPIIQEYIKEEYRGDKREHISVTFLFNMESQLRASFAYQEFRQVGGSASLAASILHPEAIECGAEFLRKLGWRGPAHVEFVIDPQDKQMKMLEINPRFWMALSLAIHAGVDFPYLLYQIIAEGDVEPVTNYRVGSHYRWFLPMDIIWFLRVTKTGHNLKEFLHFRRSDQHYAVCSASDPLPMLGVFTHASQFWKRKSDRDSGLKRGQWT